MRKIVPAVAIAAVCLASFPSRADDAGDDAGASDAGTAKLTDSEVCTRTRAPRVQAVQIRTRQWLKRLADMRAACTVAWVKTGASIVQGNRIAPETRGDVKCPKGPPAGETKESVWNALSLFLDPAPLTDEVMAVGPVGATQETRIDELNVKCVSFDAAVGVALRPLINDEPALRRILLWKATATPAK